MEHLRKGYLEFAVVGMSSIGFLAIGALPSIAADAPAPREPQAIWDKLCKSCHGADGKGNADKAKTLKIEPALLDLGRPEAAALTRDEKKKILLEGKEKMPGYQAKLKTEEIEPLLDLTEKLTVAARANR